MPTKLEYPELDVAPPRIERGTVRVEPVLSTAPYTPPMISQAPYPPLEEPKPQPPAEPFQDSVVEEAKRRLDVKVEDAKKIVQDRSKELANSARRMRRIGMVIAILTLLYAFASYDPVEGLDLAGVLGGCVLVFLFRRQGRIALRASRQKKNLRRRMRLILLFGIIAGVMLVGLSMHVADAFEENDDDDDEAFKQSPPETPRFVKDGARQKRHTPKRGMWEIPSFWKRVGPSDETVDEAIQVEEPAVPEPEVLAPVAEPEPVALTDAVEELKEQAIPEPIAVEQAT